jgi:tetratricopeptide (TPR) repeat protein
VSLPPGERTPPLGASAIDELRGLPARFRAERPLGRGSQRSVYLARDTEQERPVAVSVFDTRALSPAEIERIQQVHAAAGSGAHPHVLPIEQICEVEGRLFTVSPFVAGGDLASRLEAGSPLPLVEILRIGAQVGHALESIHAAGISHRDVKPGNILLDDRGDACLCDFGLAVDAVLGPQSAMAGTPAYIAPEQIANPPGGASADLYSLGCVLYELTTGTPPFIGEPASEILLQHQATRPVPPIERNRALPRILSELILKLLEKQPRSRPASAADVRAALEGMLRSPETVGATGAAPGSSEVRSRLLDLPFVGRERELESLGDALARTRESAPGVVLLTGDAGCGKSRLFAELRARAEAQGCVVLSGSGDELRASSYGPFTDALLPLAGHLSDLDPMHAELLRNFFYRGHDTGGFDHLAQRGAERHRLFSAAFAALSQIASTNPVVLLLEDLHAFDRSSLDLFEDLASALFESSQRRGLGLLVVASTRPRAEGHIGSLLAALRHTRECRSLELAPLDEPAIFDLLTALGSNRRPSGRLCHKVLKATDGNPLFVREVIHRLLDSGVLEPGRAESRNEPWDVEFELPRSVGHAIAERIERLSAGCGDLLALGALLGARFERSRLAVVSQHGEALFAQALGEAIDQGMLVQDGVAYRFAHPLIMQAVRDRIGTNERQSLHFRVATRLLELPIGDVEMAQIEIAHHLIRSGELADPTDLARIAGRAGQQAFARFAWHDAADLLEAAIEAASRTARLDPREHAELHRAAGLAYFRLMDEQACLSHYDAAIAGFASAGDELGLVRALTDRVRLTSLLGFDGEPGYRKRLEGELVRLDPSQTLLRAQILNTLAESYWSAGDIERAEQLGAETLAIASRMSDHHMCADACIDLGMARFVGARVEEALSTWQAAAAHARRAHDLLYEESGVARSGLALICTGRLDEAIEAARTVEEMHRVLQFQSEMSLSSGIRVAVAAIRGELAAADLHAADALARIRRVGYRWGTVFCAPALACARALGNDVAGALRALEYAVEPEIGMPGHPAFDAWGRCLAWVVHWYAGDSARIDYHAVEALQPALQGRADLNALMIACAMVELADALQAPSLAEPASGLLAAAQRQGFVFACSWPFFVPRLRGVAAMLAGKFDFAEEQLGAAIAIAERVGAAIELARARLDLARMLATRNSSGDRARAQELIRACQPVLASSGPAVFAERADRLSAFLSETDDRSQTDH